MDQGQSGKSDPADQREVLDAAMEAGHSLLATGAEIFPGEEAIDRIFERFYRVDKSHSKDIGGTGLGLAITKSAIAMHHGAIKVYSKEGEGTTFSIRIPLSYILQEVPK